MADNKILKRIIGKYVARTIESNVRVPCLIVDAETLNVSGGVSEARVYVTLDQLSDDLQRVTNTLFMPLAWIESTNFYASLALLDHAMNGNTERSDLVKKIADNKAWGIR